MEPVSEINDHLYNYWCNDEPQRAVFEAPSGMTDCAPCSAVITQKEGLVVRVPWKPSPNDLSHLVAGGTIWLSQWGGLAPHMLEVQGVPPTPGADRIQRIKDLFDLGYSEGEVDLIMAEGMPVAEEMPEDFEIALEPTTPDMADA